MYLHFLNIMGGNTFKFLPEEYQQVAYLQGNGGYLLTGITSHIDNCTYEIYHGNVSINSGLFGSTDSGPLIYGNVIGGFFMRLGQQRTAYINQSGGISVSPDADGMFLSVFDTQNNKVYCNNTEVTISGGFSVPSFNKNLPLFARIMSGNYAHISSSPIGLFRVRSYAGVVLYHFISCYRKADNEPGMYDIVNNNFITSANGGGFILGPEV